uniref:Mannose-6-phosphate isomerase n=1 Tax=Rhizophora mucronata TaxID=61149 RepID=A0A2P2JTR1_RHIMU
MVTISLLADMSWVKTDLRTDFTLSFSSCSFMFNNWFASAVPTSSTISGTLLSTPLSSLGEIKPQRASKFVIAKAISGL